MRLRNAFPSSLLFALSLVMWGTSAHAATAKLTAAQIVERNVAARGGLKAWRAVHSISMSGKMDAGRIRQVDPVSTVYRRTTKKELAEIVLANEKREENAGEVVQLPFVMKMQRPRKARLELEFQGDTAVQVFDGVHGWKQRPFLGRRDVEPYTSEELKFASQQQELDGPLIDYAAKGTKVALAGIDKVEGRKAYNLKLTLKNGQVRHVWVDAKTFLDVKIDGTRRLDGKPHPVATYFRDYRSVGGLKIPYVFETSVEGVKDTEKILIEQVEVNPKLDDSLFAKPQV